MLTIWVQVPGVTEGSVVVTLKQMRQQGGRVLCGTYCLPAPKDRTQCPFSQFSPVLHPSHHGLHLCEPVGQ